MTEVIVPCITPEIMKEWKREKAALDAEKAKQSKAAEAKKCKTAKAKKN